MAPKTAYEPSLARFSSLQAILCCPRTKTDLRLVPLEDLLSCLPEDERQRLPDETIGAFISDADRRAYPLTETIAYFLEHTSLRISSRFSETGSTSELQISVDDITESVRDWYDRFGWKKNTQSVYNDSALFSQNRLVGHGTYELMSHLSILDRLPGGDFILDAASGAIPHAEYLAFSWFLKSRVCVDMSITALQEAGMKLRQTDICCLADICKLPFRDNCFDGAVSGYTIQHIPESLQLGAVQELFRVIRPNAHLCIFTEVRYSIWHTGLFFVLRIFRKLWKVLHLGSAHTHMPPNAPGREPAPHQLYYFFRNRAWWKQVAGELTNEHSVESLRILNKSEFEWLFGQSNRAAKALRLVETAFPRLTSIMSAYCLIDLRKPDRS
ncbi:MAG: methyltransferase domain-containing protein [Nitrospira sp.]|nr:methyltransferase domain-containing protein [Nitrospira sp.]